MFAVVVLVFLITDETSQLSSAPRSPSTQSCGHCADCPPPALQEYRLLLLDGDATAS